VWSERYDPIARWVAMPAEPADARNELERRVGPIAAGDVSDAPTAALAALCAPCLPLTEFGVSFGSGPSCRSSIASFASATAGVNTRHRSSSCPTAPVDLGNMYAERSTSRRVAR
jgi:hypothetical protein